MSLRKSIHEFWKNDDLLSGQIPDLRFYTGNAPNEDNAVTPFAWMMDDVPESIEDSSEIVIDENNVVIGIRTDLAETAKEIGDILVHRMKQGTLEPTGGDDILAVYAPQTSLTELESGIWEFRATYRITTARNTARVES